MWSRGIAGFVLCLVGVVWVAQGTDAIHGSGMSGHSAYAVLGAIVIVAGVALLAWAGRVRRNKERQRA
jgi:hypothetical protein